MALNIMDAAMEEQYISTILINPMLSISRQKQIPQTLTQCNSKINIQLLMKLLLKKRMWGNINVRTIHITQIVLYVF